MEMEMKCPECRRQLGLRGKRLMVLGVCPEHGVQLSVDRQKLNGTYERMKWGGTDA